MTFGLAPPCSRPPHIISSIASQLWTLIHWRFGRWSEDSSVNSFLMLLQNCISRKARWRKAFSGMFEDDPAIISSIFSQLSTLISFRFGRGARHSDSNNFFISGQLEAVIFWRQGKAPGNATPVIPSSSSHPYKLISHRFGREKLTSDIPPNSFFSFGHPWIDNRCRRGKWRGVKHEYGNGAVELWIKIPSSGPPESTCKLSHLLMSSTSRSSSGPMSHKFVIPPQFLTINSCTFLGSRTQPLLLCPCLPVVIWLQPPRTTRRS